MALVKKEYPWKALAAVSLGYLLEIVRDHVRLLEQSADLGPGVAHSRQLLASEALEKAMKVVLAVSWLTSQPDELADVVNLDKPEEPATLESQEDKLLKLVSQNRHRLDQIFKSVQVRLARLGCSICSVKEGGRDGVTSYYVVKDQSGAEEYFTGLEPVRYGGLAIKKNIAQIDVTEKQIEMIRGAVVAAEGALSGVSLAGPPYEEVVGEEK